MGDPGFQDAPGTTVAAAAGLVLAAPARALACVLRKLHMFIFFTRDLVASQ